MINLVVNEAPSQGKKRKPLRIRWPNEWYHIHNAAHIALTPTLHVYNMKPDAPSDRHKLPNPHQSSPLISQDFITSVSSHITAAAVVAVAVADAVRFRLGLQTPVRPEHSAWDTRTRWEVQRQQEADAEPGAGMVGIQAAAAFGLGLAPALFHPSRRMVEQVSRAG
jgi:hypothetical protein